MVLLEANKLMCAQKTRRQHYISRGLMRLFSSDGKYIYECDNNKSPYRPSIEKAMLETDTYEYPLLEDNTLEEAFSNIESYFVPRITEIDRLIRNSAINIETIYEHINPLFDIFLLFYYRSGALLSEFSYGLVDDIKKQARIRRLLEIITNRRYLKELANTLRKSYNFAVLYADNGSFILCDQYISTVALTYKNQFINSSNRAIGMIGTMVLLPISSLIYIALFHGKVPDYIRANEICHLSTQQVCKINSVIYHNSFRKCVSDSKEQLESLSKQVYSSYGVEQVFFGREDGSQGGFTNKKDIYFYEEDEDIDLNRIQYALDYRNALKKHGKGSMRNIPCLCSSGKKFKLCCISKYEKAYQAVEATQHPGRQHYLIGNGVAEMPINGFWYDKKDEL